MSKKNHSAFFVASFVSANLLAAVPSLGATEWPILKHYDQAHVGQIALPIGGIGTGTMTPIL